MEMDYKFAYKFAYNRLERNLFMGEEYFPPCFSCRRCMRKLHDSPATGRVITCRCSAFPNTKVHVVRQKPWAVAGIPPLEPECPYTVEPPLTVSMCSFYEPDADEDMS